MKASVAPHSLILTYSRCDYCGEQDHMQCIIYDNFGIKTCIEHNELGKRDCNSYLYSNGMVRIKDNQHLVDALPPIFPMKRSSGELQSGWQIDCDNQYIQKIKDTWHFPCINIEHNLTKKPSINDMNHIIDVGLIESIIFQLEECLLTLSTNNTSVLEEYEEHSAIRRVFVNDVECRMLIVPSSHQDSV